MGEKKEDVANSKPWTRRPNPEKEASFLLIKLGEARGKRRGRGRRSSFFLVLPFECGRKRILRSLLTHSNKREGKRKKIACP